MELVVLASQRGGFCPTLVSTLESSLIVPQRSRAGSIYNFSFSHYYLHCVSTSTQSPSLDLTSTVSSFESTQSPSLDLTSTVSSFESRSAVILDFYTSVLTLVLLSCERC